MFATPADQGHNQITSVPAPIGGINARDSLAAMPETDAVSLVNFWPQPYGVSVRRGWQVWNTLAGAPEIGTLGAWSGADGQQKLFAWGGAEMWDVSARNSLPPTALVTGLTNAYWQLAGMTNAAGGWLLAVNGADDGIFYGPAGVGRLILGDGVAADTWKGLDPKEAIQLAFYEHHLWAVKKNSSVGYFLKTADAYYGDFGTFDFGGVFQRGGYLAFLANWTIDDGNGAGDHLVAVSSTGSAVVYSGLDPSDPNSWKLVGSYFIGAPVKGRRSYVKVGGDLFILTQQGVVSMSGMLASTKVNDQKQSFPSDKIQFLMSEVTSQYGDLSNWQLAYVPKINMLICNVPTPVDTANFQLVSNQITGAWAQFSGMDATVWNTFDSQPFFGTYDGKICLAWYGYLDGVNAAGDGGTSVTCSVQQAYSYLNSPAAQKQVGMYRPTLIVERDVVFSSSIAYDFRTGSNLTPGGVPTLPDPFGARWDQGLWDQARWYGGSKQQRGWVQASGMGVAASLTMTMRASGETLWVSTDYSYKSGGIL